MPVCLNNLVCLECIPWLLISILPLQGRYDYRHASVLAYLYSVVRRIFLSQIVRMKSDQVEIYCDLAAILVLSACDQLYTFLPESSSTPTAPPRRPRLRSSATRWCSAPPPTSPG